MKKSEKIEIRISHAEKESLARLAESEGQSVSELIRGLARKHAQINMLVTHRKFSKLHMAGLLIFGASFGSVIAVPLVHKLTPSTPTHYMVHGTLDNQGFGFDVHKNIKSAKVLQ